MASPGHSAADPAVRAALPGAEYSRSAEEQPSAKSRGRPEDLRQRWSAQRKAEGDLRISVYAMDGQASSFPVGKIYPRQVTLLQSAPFNRMAAVHYNNTKRVPAGYLTGRPAWQSHALSHVMFHYHPCPISPVRRDWTCSSHQSTIGNA